MLDRGRRVARGGGEQLDAVLAVDILEQAFDVGQVRIALEHDRELEQLAVDRREPQAIGDLAAIVEEHRALDRGGGGGECFVAADPQAVQFGALGGDAVVRLLADVRFGGEWLKVELDQPGQAPPLVGVLGDRLVQFELPDDAQRPPAHPRGGRLVAPALDSGRAPVGVAPSLHGRHIGPHRAHGVSLRPGKLPQHALNGKTMLGWLAIAITLGSRPPREKSPPLSWGQVARLWGEFLALLIGNFLFLGALWALFTWLYERGIWTGI